VAEVLPPAPEPPVAQVTAPVGLAPSAPQHVQQVIAIPTGNGTHVHASVNLAVAVSVQVASGGTLVTASPVAAIGAQAPLSKPQDEWGFFDPAQCGLEALIARIDRVDRRSD
jgi:hypothetical protein